MKNPKFKDTTASQVSTFLPRFRCDHSCYECLGPGERNCSSCVSGYNLEVGSCVVSTICKDGEFSSFSYPTRHTQSFCSHLQKVFNKLTRVHASNGKKWTLETPRLFKEDFFFSGSYTFFFYNLKQFVSILHHN